MCTVLSKDDVDCLREAAAGILRSDRPFQFGVAPCKYLYRNKLEEYFKEMSTEGGGIMTTYLKDASGDKRSPINGEICGLFFNASARVDGQPFATSPFGNTRVLINVEEIFSLMPNVFFADFFCMRNKRDRHYVTIVLTKNGSSADKFCNRCLPELSLGSNPFLCKRDGQFWVSKDVYVEVFVTEDLNVKSMIERGVAEMQYNIPSTGMLGRTSQGGCAGTKSTDCERCNIFADRPVANNRRYYAVY